MDASGRVIGASTIARDITERKRTEEKIRELNASLERRVSELVAANKELESFSYSVSHDLRAPLRAMDGFSQALLEDYADELVPEAKRYLQHVREASQRMDYLVNGILDLSRTARSEMQRTTVDMSALAETIALELKQAHPERRVEFVAAPRVVVNADGTLLRSALENLLGNAWKFTSQHARARIELGTMQQDGGTVYFVRDDGAGFDPAYANKLFGPFQRLHSPAEFPGTGIGLAIVQRIIERHGGRIWAEGYVELGATFFFTLG
jgi:light-regulated signal transduction histidine kinase (bacteriophytochrome)